MNFELDKQTIRDLEIFGNEKSPLSIHRFYNHARTMGGKKYLFELMQSPLTDIDEIHQRKEAIKFICETEFELTINSTQFDFIDHYLNLNIIPLRNNFLDAYFDSFSYQIKPKNDYYIIQAGVRQLTFLFQHLDKKLKSISGYKLPSALDKEFEKIKKYIAYQEIKEALTAKEKISCVKLNRFDWLFRKKYKIELLEVIQTIYTLDAYISVAKTAKLQGLCFADYLAASKPSITITGLFHPLIEKAVPYEVVIDDTKNMCFLTGPNMAGKSTFLKSIGLSIYLSHLGFPVPARQMKTTIFNGIITTINLTDNLNLGYSHFYSEVRRVKETALKIKEKGNMFVIFDELFRGTNVKDAFDASLIIIKSFAKISNCMFCISTHITEVAKELMDVENIQFNYFESKLENDTPVYSYKLLKGISHERLGMLIIKNEKIIDILNSIVTTESQYLKESS
jgi:DNA mismatch repair ATPase MutS